MSMLDDIGTRLRWLTPWHASRDNVEAVARSYGNALYIAAKGASSASGDEMDQLAGRIEAELDKEEVNLRQIFAIETRMAKDFPPDIKRRRYWEYRERFERIASPAQLAAYLASNPPGPPPADPNDPPSAPPAINDADNIVLLDHIHKNYIITHAREHAVSALKSWIQNSLLVLFLSFAVIILILLVFSNGGQGRGWLTSQIVYFSIGVMLLFFLGRVGAAMSVVQRLQRAVVHPDKDPFFEITALCTGRRGISIAMLSGGVFAILLYVIFAAGLGAILGMRGGIFPEVGQGSPAALAQASAAPAESAPPDSPSSDSASADSAPALPALPKPPESEESGPTAPDGAAEANGVQAAAPGNDMAAASNVPPSTAPAPAPRSRPAGGKDQAQGKTPGQCGPDKTICVPAFVSDIGRHLGFREYPDFFKMLLLAFLAGFAERLVPDALDRLTRRTGGAPTDRDHDRAAAVAVQAGSE